MCIRIVKTLWKDFFKTLKSNFGKNQVQMDPFISYDVEFSSFIGQNRRQFTHCNDKRHLRHVFGYEIVVIKLKYIFGIEDISWLWIKRPRGSEFDINVIWNLTGWLKTGKKTGFKIDLKSFYRTLCWNKRKLNWQPPEVVNCCHLNSTWICLICPGERYLMARSKG